MNKMEDLERAFLHDSRLTGAEKISGIAAGTALLLAGASAASGGRFLSACCIALAGYAGYKSLQAAHRKGMKIALERVEQMLDGIGEDEDNAEG